MSDSKVEGKGSPYQGRQVEVTKRAKNRELRTIDEAHRQHVNQLEKANQQEIVEVRDQHSLDIAAENDKKEKILMEMQKQLSTTKAMTDKEIHNLKAQTEKTRTDYHSRLAGQRDVIRQEHELNLEDTNYRYSKNLQDLNSNMDNRIQVTKESKLSELSETERFNQNKINNQKNEFQTRFETDDKNYTKIKKEQDTQFKRERLDTYSRHNGELDKINNQGRKDIKKHTENYQKGLKDQDLVFEKKYADSIKKNGEDLKRLEDLNKKSVNNIKAAMHKEIKLSESRQGDPFYEFIEMKPQLSKTPDGYEIRVTVPEYAKQDVIMTTNTKEVVLTMNRRYVDNRKDENGNSTKINKVETLVTRLPVDNVLNPKSQKSNYDSGVLTFTINKA